ncbi:MAG: D-aminoacylase [Candidatus Aminicenantales bacterium]
MKIKPAFFSLFLLTGMIFWVNASLPEQKPSSFDFDVLIKKAMVYDGSLNPAFTADIAIKDDTILKIAKSIPDSAARVINAKGLVASPGFIDLHTHVDEGMYFQENRACQNYLQQGVTTVIVGQCGSSAWPVFEKAEDLITLWTREGIGPNAALLVGHGTVRQAVMGMENRMPTPEELEKMKALVTEAMEQGACGISTGLVYLPGAFAKTDEVVELVKMVAPYHGIYHTHIRNERDKLLDAVSEAIEISEKTGVPAHISHLKVMGKANWGLVKDACALIEKARARGLKITADQYPYEFSSGYPYQSLIPRGLWLGKNAPEQLSLADIEKILEHLGDSELIDLYQKLTIDIPLSAHHEEFLNSLSRKRLVSFIARNFFGLFNLSGPENPRERMLFWKRWQDPEEAKKIRQGIRAYIENSVGSENFIIGICAEKNLEGKSLKEAAAIKGKSIEDAAVELELMGAKCIPFQMREEDIEFVMKKDYVGTGSDGTAPFYGIGLTHIRSYSTFLHKIKKYALQKKVVSLAHVIRSQTSLPAQIMNWNDRGWIKEGYKADIVLLDLNKMKIKTSISNPHQYSEGVVYLWINGTLVIDNGQWNGKLPGKVLTLKTSNEF